MRTGSVRRALSAGQWLAPVIGLAALAMGFAAGDPWRPVLLVAGAGLAGWGIARGLAAGHAPVAAAGSHDGAIARLLEPFPNPVLVLDGNARILTANQAARQINPAVIVGRHVSSVLRTPSLLKAVERVRGGAPSQSVDYTVPVPVERHFRAFVTPCEWRDTAVGTSPVLIVLDDLSAAKRVEQMRADFVASASHELRTPLASLSGFIETLRGPAKDDPQARERFLQIMEEQANRMKRLVSDLLSLSRIELNEHVPPADEVDLSHLLHAVVEAAGPLVTESGVEVAIEGAGAKPVLGDYEELFQVFQNLLDNALNYGASGGRIEIGIASGALNDPGAPVQSVCSVSVRDYGPGIPREHIPRLTERFYRADVGDSRRKGGTGLGLAIVKHIVNRHRGWLEIRSAVGEGSVFTVHLPRARPENAVLDDAYVTTLTIPAPKPDGDRPGRRPDAGRHETGRHETVTKPS